VSSWVEAYAPAKVNLALVVGPLRTDGKHEVATVLERLSLADMVAVRRAPATRVGGFAGDTLVRGALDAVTRAVDGAVFFEARIEKRVPVAGGLGGGSSDAAAALTLANSLLEQPLDADVLERLAGSLGADVPFFLRDGTQLGIDDGTTLLSIGLPRDYAVLLALPHGAVKASTADVYAAFDARRGDIGFDGRRAALLGALERLARAADLGHLPSNDLASSPLAPELRDLGAIRADATGAGPVAYGVFPDRDAAERAAAALGHRASTWVATPA